MLTTYGRSSGFCVDPIEKKPLNHFLPGIVGAVVRHRRAATSPAGSARTGTSRSRRRSTRSPTRRRPTRIAEAAQRARLPQRRVHLQRPDDLHGVRDRRRRRVPRARHQRGRGHRRLHLRRAARASSTRTSTPPTSTSRRFTEDFYRHVVRRPSRRRARHARVPRARDRRVGRDHERCSSPGKNDCDDELDAMTRLGRRAPRARRADALHRVPPRLQDARHRRRRRRRRSPARARSRSRNGVRYAYTGNVHDRDGGSTYCPACGALARSSATGTRSARYHLTDDGRCRVVRHAAARAASTGPPARGARAACRCGSPDVRDERADVDACGRPRSPARFYPGDAGALARRSTRLLAGAPRRSTGRAARRRSSSRTPATCTPARSPRPAYATLAPARDTIRRVVLLGPAHRVPRRRARACRSADAFAHAARRRRRSTPTLRDRVARAARRRRRRRAPHAPEHSLEVHLPFLQRVLARLHACCRSSSAARRADDGRRRARRAVGRPRDAGRREHRPLPLPRPRRRGARTTARDRRRDRRRRRSTPSARTTRAARYPLRGLLAAAARRGLDAELLDLRNSGDTAGHRDRVVGYGAFALVRGRSTRHADGPSADRCSTSRARGARRRRTGARHAARRRVVDPRCAAGRDVRDARARRPACSAASARSSRDAPLGVDVAEHTLARGVRRPAPAAGDARRLPRDVGEGLGALPAGALDAGSSTSCPRRATTRGRRRDCGERAARTGRRCCLRCGRRCRRRRVPRRAVAKAGLPPALVAARTASRDTRRPKSCDPAAALRRSSPTSRARPDGGPEPRAGRRARATRANTRWGARGPQGAADHSRSSNRRHRRAVTSSCRLPSNMPRAFDGKRHDDVTVLRWRRFDDRERTAHPAGRELPIAR